MLSFTATPEALERLVEQAREQATLLRDGLGDLADAETLELGADACRCFPGTVLYVRDGALKLQQGGKMIRLVNVGDLFAVPVAAPANVSLDSDFSARLLVWDRADLLAELGRRPDLAAAWHAHRELEIRILQGLCAVYATEHVEPSTALQRVEPGAFILCECQPADEIYVLISGEATVEVEGVEVGRILEGEVFGEMGFFTDQHRTATVAAVRECTVQRISRDDFERLVATRPQLATTLLRTMAERVVAVNTRLVHP